MTLRNPATTGRTVLIVEDDPDIRTLLEQRVRRLGHDAIATATGEAGLASCRDALPDLILLDLRLPGMDGWAFLDALRSSSAQDTIPVVVVSIVDEDEAVHPVVDGYLTKPFRTAAVDDVLRRHLDRKEPDDEPRADR